MSWGISGKTIYSSQPKWTVYTIAIVFTKSNYLFFLKCGFSKVWTTWFPIWLKWVHQLLWRFIFRSAVLRPCSFSWSLTRLGTLLQVDAALGIFDVILDGGEPSLLIFQPPEGITCWVKIWGVQDSFHFLGHWGNVESVQKNEKSRKIFYGRRSWKSRFR